MIAELYKFEGRYGRLTYFWKNIVVVVLFAASLIGGSIILGLLSTMFPPVVSLGLSVVGILFLLSFYIPVFANGAKRLHDISLSGWWQLIPIIASFAFGFYLADQYPEILSLLITEPSNEEIKNILLGSSIDLTGLSLPYLAVTIINLGFYLMLLFWPGKKAENKYGVAGGKYYKPMGASTKERLSSVEQPRKYSVKFVEAIPEDSLYIMKHLSKNTREVMRINMPEDRKTAEFVINGNSKYHESDVKKVLQELGISVKSVVPIE